MHHDYRGCGQSESAPTESYTIERLAADLDELREALGDEKVTMLAHSMGGYVALSYAVRYPERCERLVLAGTWPTTVPRQMLPPTFRALGWARSTKMLARALWWVAAWSWRRRTVERRRRLFGIWTTLQEGRPEIRTREAERERRLGLPQKNDNIRGLQRDFRTWDCTDRLHAITCPVLVLHGDRDAAAVAGAQVFGQHIAGVEIRALPDIGHNPFFEAPDASLRAVRTFLT